MPCLGSAPHRRCPIPFRCQPARTQPPRTLADPIPCPRFRPRMFWCRSLFLSWVRSGSLPFVASLRCRDLRLPGCRSLPCAPFSRSSFWCGTQIAWLLVPACAPSFRSGACRWPWAPSRCCRDLMLPGCWYLLARLLSGLPVAEGSFPLVPGPQIAWLLYLPARLLSGLLVATGSFVLLPGSHFFAVGDVPARLVSGRLASFHRWPRAPSCCWPGPHFACGW